MACTSDPQLFNLTFWAKNHESLPAKSPSHRHTARALPHLNDNSVKYVEGTGVIYFFTKPTLQAPKKMDGRPNLVHFLQDALSVNSLHTRVIDAYIESQCKNAHSLFTSSYKSFLI